VRNAGRDLYTPPLQHLSYTLAGAPGMIGRSGVTICGLRNAADQDRAQHLVSRRDPKRNIKIHELRRCRVCYHFVRR